MKEVPGGAPLPGVEDDGALAWGGPVVREHCGDGLLPVAVPRSADFQTSQCSRKVRQLLGRSNALDVKARESLECVNRLAGYATPVVGTLEDLSVFSKAAWERAVGLHACRPKLDDAIQDHEACSALLGFSGSAY